ncbi:hypothetical protein AP071_11940 [Rhodobacter capsulatus]|nr:hypothetical protein AP073_12955 [Rhodobacter capsulatus]KQB16326.1 hypothetical protein AP071_11940 [Rhodobacter capsulatus]
MVSDLTLDLTEAIAEVTRHTDPEPVGGAKAPGQRPSRPWRALLARRAGHRPLVCLGKRS